ncbi:5062_t:CDS:2 [Ambispora gerdemannii]|uniref:5062_t:CDS:1 n=1 Tax=Ambispora gerdemannii TaxID=144530 RepID=A0A9N9FV98_9GLOM|nr:5062_t:CDS:2 [Ambispora gerdemannii]
MGNQQSNENTRKSIIITRTVAKEGRVMDENQKYIDLANSEPYNNERFNEIFGPKGVFPLDFTYTIKHSHTKTFGVGEFKDLMGDKEVEEEV